MISFSRENNDKYPLRWISHGICEALLYAWLIGVTLPHTNFFYNLGLYGAPLVAIPYLIVTRGDDLKRIQKPFGLSFLLFVTWNLVACFWSSDVLKAFADWRGNLGIALQMAIIFFVIFQKRESQSRLWVFLLGLCLCLVVMFCGEWLAISRKENVPIPPYPTMRSWGGQLIMLLPFLAFGGVFLYKRWMRFSAFILIGIFSILMLITMARGVWLALVIFLMAFALRAIRDKKKILLLLLSCFLVLGVLWISPGSQLKSRASNIAYTGDRMSYTWGPAIRFWLESLIAGIGYGTDSFHAKASELSENDPTWLKDVVGDKSVYINLGPHSNYFEVLSAGGIVGLFLLLYFYHFVIRNILLSWQSGNALLVSSAMVVLTKYMVHGMVESISWKLIGIFVGLMLASLASSEAKIDQ